jgi:hypothetical protein
MVPCNVSILSCVELEWDMSGSHNLVGMHTVAFVVVADWYLIQEDGITEMHPTLFLAPKMAKTGYPPLLEQVKEIFPPLEGSPIISSARLPWFQGAIGRIQHLSVDGLCG